MTIPAFDYFLNDLLSKVRRDHPVSDDIELFDYMIAEVQKPGNELLIETCIRYACFGAVEDYRAAEEHHQARGAR
jgi:hypothetical protein